VWPAIAIAVVLWLTWSTLRGVHIREVRAALRALDAPWIWAAGGFTALNVAVMGLYDVVAFRDTRSPALQRWRYGAIAFAWSNFLTLGPLAGPAIRFWLYAPAIDRAADLQGGVVATAIAFTAGLAGWTTAVALGARVRAGLMFTAVIALAATLVIVIAIRAITKRVSSVSGSAFTAHPTEMALVGWLDWMLAAAAFLCTVRAGLGPGIHQSSLPAFFLGQVVGLASLAPGGFGSADAYWIARLPAPAATAAAIVAAFRLVYYVVPWTLASLVLLSWATRRAQRRIEIARRVIAGLIGGGGVLMMLSSASPALHARLLVLERLVPLPLVEFGQVVAAMTGLLLLALALKLARGYRAAFRATIVLLGIGAISALLKGFDWEEAVVLGTTRCSTATVTETGSRGPTSRWLRQRSRRSSSSACSASGRASAPSGG
jgi:phosphatidylglycerol lysyltransferase